MLQHLIKLTWNKKRKNFLIMLEVFVSFLVLFAVFTLLYYRFQNYKQPVGFRYDNVWATNIFTEDRTRNWGQSDSLAAYHEPLVQALRSFPEVQAFSFSRFNTPFAPGQSSTMIKSGNNRQMADLYNTDDRYAEVLGLPLKEGRWYNKQDDGLKETPVVINESLRQHLFGNEPALNKILITGFSDTSKLKVIGVVTDFKDKGEFMSTSSGIFIRMTPTELASAGTVLVSMRPGSDAAVEGRLQKAMGSQIKNGTVRIDRLTAELSAKNKEVLIPMIVLFVVCAFLIINVGLGLLGILWYNINRRKAEIGLRRAVGATGRGVSQQLVGEALVMATLALGAGCFFALQFPLLHVFNLSSAVYLTGLLSALVFIYILVILCALYPGRQAASIYPAVVLHED
jgi:putative ABC transport system permease protein